MGGDGAKCKIFRQFVYLVSAVSLLPLTIYVVSTNRLRNVDDQEVSSLRPKFLSVVNSKINLDKSYRGQRSR